MTATADRATHELPELRSAPPDLRGRPRADRLFRAVGALISGYEWLTRHTGPRLRPAPPPRPELRVRVEQVRQEARDVRSFLLADPSGAPLPAWQPGSHVEVRLPSGRRRHYSLCGDPADRARYRIAVRLLADGGGGGGSRELHDDIAPGATVTLRGPRNGFPFIAGEDAYLFVAGGIGITPILPMVRQAAADGAEWRLVYTGRSPETMPFVDELAALDPGRVEIRPDSVHGVPTSGAQLLAGAPPGARVYCCGPAPLMAAVRRDLAASPAQALHLERFTPPPVRDGRPFQVTLRRSGQVLQVPADRSALEVIRETLPEVAYSCRQGFCGTCRTRVLAGRVEHRDRVLTAEQRRDSMTICVSRAAQDGLVLDL